MFDGCDFLAELTQHIPPKGVQYIRRYGLYSSRTRGKWAEHPGIVKYAPEQWKINHLETFQEEDFSEDERECNISTKTCRKAWARMLAKIYEINPYTCPKCGSDMKVIAVIQDSFEIKKILRHLKKVDRAPPGVVWESIE